MEKLEEKTTVLSIADEIIKKLWRKNRNFCSTDYDDSLDYLGSILPFKIHGYTQPYNHWQIPPKWDLVHASISFKGNSIFQVDHPLKIIGLSKSFKGTVTKEELQKHLHFDHRYPDAVPYHFRQFYRPWDRDWGFCVTKNFYDTLQEGDYDIAIETQESSGQLKVAEYIIKGKNPECFVFVAHLDHPGMANDDLAGVAVAVEFFERLSKIETKFTYKLILVPEIIGSEFYLGLTDTQKSHTLGGCFLEMLGSQTPLALQWSLNQNSIIELHLKETLKEHSIPFSEGAFKTIICNDEAVWESHQIPMCSLSRFPYPEYHSSRDNPEIISQRSLDESIQILNNVVLSMEKLSLFEKKFHGTPCTSHPELNLYVDPGQRAFGSMKNSNIQKHRLLMDLLPTKSRYFTVDELINETGLNKKEVLGQLEPWTQSGLLRII